MKADCAREFDFVRYTPERADEWNLFVARSKNGTFLFNRGYMDYHRDRFDDCSWMVYKHRRLFALLPGNQKDSTFFSHQGLTYGGFITDIQATAAQVCKLFTELNEVLRSNGFQRIVYKPMPWIYQQMPAEEDVYALSLRCGARLIERDASAVVNMACRPKFTESRLSGLRKALRAGLRVRESDDIVAFWSILSDNLQIKYGAKPVHTISEMQLLKRRFPENIRLFMAYRDEEPLGGTVLYLTPQVVHTQYISASSEGKQVGALDYLFDHLLNKTDFGRPYFDFGTSALPDSNEVNASLMFQKEGFGGRCVCYDWYEWDL